MNSTSFLQKLGKDESGATAVEYGLIAALIVIGMLGGLSLLASGNSGMWADIETKSAEAMTP